MKQSMLCLGLIACGAPPPPAAPPRTAVAGDARALLDAWATAVGGRERLARIDAVQLTGALEAGGLTGRFTIWETAAGQRRDEEELGPIGGSTTVFDGARGWEIDRNRKVRPLDGAELADQVALAYLGAYAPLVVARRPGRVARDGDALRIEPDGGRTLTVTFDPASHLPRAISRRDGARTRVLALSDWRDVAGVRFPFTIRDSDGEARDARVLHVAAITTDRAPATAAFARPADPPPDYRFAAGGSATMPIELASALVFVQVRVNGSPPMSFIVDTGASASVLNRSRVARLGLAAMGELAGGAGGGNVDVSYVKGVSFELPGLRVRDQTVTAIPLDALEAPAGHAIDGILGYDFLSRFVVELDYARTTLTVYDHATGHRPHGLPVPITLDDGVPNVVASVDIAGQPAAAGRFIIDTGCTCELSFHAPFTRDHHLIEASPAILTAPRGASGGAGGATDDVLGRVAGLSIAGLHLPSLLASFSRRAGAGVDANPDRAGLIGGKLWRRFVVTFDYDRKTMWLDPRPGFDQPSSLIGTGVRWTLHPPAFAVLWVMDGAPGAEAGLVAGDQLISVDGTPATDHTLATLEALFARDGARHVLVVRRGAAEHTLAVTPRKLI